MKKKTSSGKVNTLQEIHPIQEIMTDTHNHFPHIVNSISVM